MARGEIRAPGRQSARIVAGAVKGYIDATTQDGDTVRFSGWAVEDRGRSPVDRVLAFAEGRLVYAGAPQLARPDVARDYGAPAARLGFGFTLDRATVEQAKERVQVFALSGRVASPVAYLCEKEAKQVTGCP